MIKPVLTLYPTTQRLTDAIDRLMEGEGEKALLIPGMMTIGRFEKLLTTQLLGPRRQLARLGRALLMTRIIQRRYARNRNSIFDRAERFPGFLEAVLDFFDELGAGLVEPETLDKIKDYAPGKETEISFLYHEYRRELTRLGFCDLGMTRRDLVAVLDGDCVKKSPTLSRYSGIRLEDVYQFTPYRFELFRKLALKTSVTISAPLPDNRRRAFGFVVMNLARFEALGDKAGQMDIEFRAPEASPLSALRDRLFNLHNEPAQATPAGAAPVTILSCSSRYREIEEVCARIHKLKNDEGLQWRDFALVFRDARLYGAIVEDVFRRYAVPFFIKRGLSLSMNPLIRSVLAIFVAIETGYARDDVARITDCSCFDRFAPLDGVETQKLYMKAGIIDGTPAIWRRKLASALDNKMPDKAGASLIADLTGQLLARLEKLKRQNRPPKFLECFDELLSWLQLNPSAGYQGPKQETIRFRDHNACNQLMEIIEETRLALKNLKMGNRALGFDRIKNLLLGAIEKRSAPERASIDRNRVSALNVHDVAGLKVNTVFVCGLHEGEFPQRQPARPILTEEQREVFNARRLAMIPERMACTRKGRRVFDRLGDKWQEESLLFYQAVMSATQRITFTYSLQGLDGKPFLRSLFINDVLDAISPATDISEREKLVTTTPSLAIQKAPEELIDRDERLTRLLRDLFKQTRPDRELEDAVAQIARGAPRYKRFLTLLKLCAMERRRDLFFAEPDSETGMRLVTEHNGRLVERKKEVKKILLGRQRGRYSPTALEKYGQCPFRYFAGALLGLEPVKEPLVETEPMVKGSMFHQILENFYGKLIKKGRARLSGDPWECKLLSDEAHQVFGVYSRQGKTGVPAIWSVQRETILTTLQRWLRTEIREQEKTGFIPVAVELAFDLPDKLAPAPLASPAPPASPAPLEPLALEMRDGGKRFMVGRVDRVDIDLAGGRARAVDYKSSSNSAKYQKMMKSENFGVFSFQAPLYMILARDYVLRSGVMPEARETLGAYQLLMTPDDKKAYICAGAAKRDEPPDEKAFIDKTIDTIEKIENGLFHVQPMTCDLCQFPGLCRYIAVPTPARDEQ